MVLDEELKMMATVAEHGGQVVGPYLKEMAHLAHTEYLLAGRGSQDVREVLRETMFAPTVTGSPMENACRVIARHERRGRGYYAGRAGAARPRRRGPADAGRADPDPHRGDPPGRRAAGAGRRDPGAPLHRRPARWPRRTPRRPGCSPRSGSRPAARRAPAVAPGARARRRSRGPGGARRPQRRAWPGSGSTSGRPGAPALAGLAGRRALIVDGEDTFTGMLAHQLRRARPRGDVRPWHRGRRRSTVRPGRGRARAGRPGATRRAEDGALRALLRAGSPPARRCSRSASATSCSPACWGCGCTGGTRRTRESQRDVDLFGTPRRVGFYSTFTALADARPLATPYGRVELARDPADGAVHALRGPGFAGVQFHPESVLSRDGLAVLADLLGHLLARPALTAHGPADRGYGFGDRWSTRTGGPDGPRAPARPPVAP